MGRRGKRVDRGGGGAQDDASPGGSLVPARGAHELFVLTERHAELLRETARARPELIPQLDLRFVEPGSESVESMSQRAHAWLRERGFDLAVFKLLCHLNAERLLAEIARQIDEQGLPWDEREILADLYARLQRHYVLRGVAAPRFGDREAERWLEPMGGSTTVFRGLAETTRVLLAERVQMLAARAVPLVERSDAAAASTPVAPAEALVADAARHLVRRRCRLPLDTLRQWTACALMRLPAEQRRLLHLRLHRSLEIRDLARHVGCTPLDAGVRLNRALQALLDELDSLLVANEPEAAATLAAGPEPEVGRVVRFPGAHAEGEPPNLSADPAVEDDEGERDG